MPKTSSPAHQPLQWGARALWLQLEPLLPGLSLEVLARVDSTNSHLVERARSMAGRRAPEPSGQTVPGEVYRGHAGDTDPYLLVAEHQTQGRGRLGRSWHATPGASLTFSLALALERADWSALSLAVGVALADALDPPSGSRRPRLRLKWPNDILLAPDPTRPEASARKLAGILIESVAVGARRIAVIGVGINIGPQTLTDTGWGCACLQEIETDVTAPSVLARVAGSLIEAVLRFDRAGFAPFAAGFARRDVLIGQSVSTTSAQWPEGVAEGVDAAGALLLRVGGVQQRIQSGEVSLRLRAPQTSGGQDSHSGG